ncbi:tectonin domain-containing protein [Sorangium sp. So ce426]|uniref:tectonin domain-containing protein n=1 Tax=Sorangium sp. So ce426 TaxID=3133312 RepID=UPI003F5BD148
MNAARLDIVAAKMKSTTRATLVLCFVSLASCGGAEGPRIGGGYQEYECPAPVGKIVREDCSQVALRYEGASFKGTVGAGPVSAEASYKQTAIREADALVAMLKENRVALCNNFNTCKMNVTEYKQEQAAIDDSYMALLALKDRMAQLDAEGAAKLLTELQKIRLRTPSPVTPPAGPPSTPPDVRVTQSGDWTQLDGSAFDVGVGAGGSVWVIGINSVPGGYGIYHRTGASWTSIDGGAVRIAVDPSGEPWVVNSGDFIFRHTPTGWQQLPGSAKDIGVGANGAVWIIGTDSTPGGFGVHRWTGASWTRVEGGAVRIAVDPSGEPWVVNSSDAIFRHTAGGWQQLPGSAKDIGVGANGAVWVIGTNSVPGGFDIYRWAGATWVSVPGGATQISVSPEGKPWVVNSDRAIFRWN